MDVRRKIQTVILSLILSILMMFEIILVCILMAPGMYNDSNFRHTDPDRIFGIISGKLIGT